MKAQPPPGVWKGSMVLGEEEHRGLCLRVQSNNTTLALCLRRVSGSFQTVWKQVVGKHSFSKKAISISSSILEQDNCIRVEPL